MNELQPYYSTIETIKSAVIEYRGKRAERSV